MAREYLQPIGFLYAAAAREATVAGVALALGGSSIAFQSLRVWHREKDHVVHKIVPVAALRETADASLRATLERMCADRPAIAGLNFDMPAVMGILNATPDSFSDGGDYLDPDIAVTQGVRMVNAGADIIDVGGESTRPGAETVPVAEELRRVLPIIKALSQHGIRISVDTRKPDVMAAAADAGAAILNDVSGLTYAPDSPAIAARLQLPTILMHAQGDPKTMQSEPRYADVVLDVYDHLESRIRTAIQAGLPRQLLVADPGLGFGKTLNHNLSLMQNLSMFHGLGVPLLIGASRKRTIRDITAAATPKDTVPGNIASALSAISQGVHIIRAHDIIATRQAILMWKALHS